MSLKNLPPDSRPREKLLHRGAASLSDAELLAILLRTGTQGKGVLQLCEELLALQVPPPLTPQASGVHGIAGLLNASAASLRSIKGLGPAKRCIILAVMELARRSLAQQLTERTVLADPVAVRQYVQLHLAHLPHEVFAVLFLDNQCRLLAMEELFRGTVSHTSVYPREVVVRALHHQASAVVLAHNHPSAMVLASQADQRLTDRLRSTLSMVDVRVLDHIIVGPGQAYSMAEHGQL